MTQDKMQQAPRLPGTLEEPFDFAKWWDRVGIRYRTAAIVLLMASTAAPSTARVGQLPQHRAFDLGQARSWRPDTFVILTAGIDLSVGSIVAVSGVASVLAASLATGAAAILASMAVGAVCGLVSNVLTAIWRWRPSSSRSVR